MNPFSPLGKLLRPVFQYQIELFSKNLKIPDVVRDEDKIVGNCDGGNLCVQDGGGFPDGKKPAGNVSVDGCGVDVVGDYRKRGLNIIIQERKQLAFFRALWQQGNTVLQLIPCNAAYTAGAGVQFKICQQISVWFRLCDLRKNVCIQEVYVFQNKSFFTV